MKQNELKEERDMNQNQQLQEYNNKSRTTRSRCKNKEAVLQCENKELEQYDRRLCLRVESVPSTDKETSEGVLEKFLFFDRAYRIGNG